MARGVAAAVLVMVATLAASVHHEASAYGPVSAASDFETVGDKNTEHLIQLRPNIRIPDFGELNWPIHVPDSYQVADAKVSLTGLYHPHASDLRIQLRHEEVVVDVTNGCAEDKKLGKPTFIPTPVIEGTATPEVTGTGFKYTFEDALGTNLALNANASQSTTRFGGTADLAVDGNVDGFFSSGSVTHTGDDLVTDPQAWWMVDLEEDQFIGSVRIWNRQDEIETEEIQVVTTSAAGILAGNFTLSFTYRSQTLVTDYISVNAVAMRDDEVPDSTVIGQRPGDSVQALLEDLDNIGQVRVARSLPSVRGGYSWSITFMSEPGDVPELQVEHNGITSAAGVIRVRTPVQGSSNIWENEEGEQIFLTGRLVPSYLMILANGTDLSLPLHELRAQAEWETRLTEPFRQQLIATPVNTTGRYVRIQLEGDDHYLSLAEVQVYTPRSDSLCSFAGGSPLPAGSYHGTESLQGGYFGAESYGSWVLTIDDLVARERVYSTNSRPDVFIHGQGGLQWWTLDLVDTNGVVTTYHSDVTFMINTLPVYGQLFSLNATNGDHQTFGIVEGRHKYLSECYDDCTAKFGVGVVMSTSPDGSIASMNRITAERNLRSVLYVPTTDWLGSDTFTYTVYIGVTPSTRGTVTVHTRRCRLDCDNEQFDDFQIVRRV